tara:strand:- start:859 stop:2634 length:1776 start_codon:yes stop_codon:yes gene_type:complete
MPNLDNIHFKFFPKAKTAPYGKTLIKFAWVIEIIVATVGLTIAAFLYMRALDGSEDVSTATTWTEKLTENIDGVIVSLAFVVVSVVELTKIPLATAFYYAAKTRWKITFIVALILINISTFETIIQGFELGFYKRSNEVAKVKQKLEDINSTINEKTTDTEGDKKSILKDESEILNSINSINKQITDVNIEKNNQIDALKNQSALANPQIETKQKQISESRKSLEAYKIAQDQKISNKNKEISDLELMEIVGQGWGKRKDAENKRKERDAKVKIIRNDLRGLEQKTETSIKSKEQFIRTLESEKDKLDGGLNREITDKISNIEDIAELRKEKIQIDLNNKREQLSVVQSRINDFDNKTINYQNEVIDLREQCRIVADDLEKVALDNQTYRFAIKIKSFRGWFTSLSPSSILPWNWGKEKEVIKVTTNDVKVEEKKCSSSSAALLSDDDLNFAFWLWFGTLAFVISVIGTLIALAGLHLQDERMHEIRNRPMKERFARFFRNIAWIPVYINKYIWAGVKRLTKPKIIEKEVIVEKEVEKIIEKHIGEKIIYEKVEVPKEVVRKEMVYVPLPTDDEELLKRGPFTAVDKDKKK